MYLEPFLESLGLDKNDQKVYLAIYALADAPASLIAQKAGVKRTTAYTILEKLKKMGLVSSYRTKSSIRYFAENPNKIRQFLEERITTFNERVLPELRALGEIPRSTPRIRVFEGEKGLQSILNEALECEEKIIYSMGSYKKYKEAVKTGFVFTERRVAKGILSKALRTKEEIKAFKPGYIDIQKEELREVRWLPSTVDLDGYIMIWDNKTAFISGKDELFGFIIESNDFSKSMKKIFDSFWNSSE